MGTPPRWSGCGAVRPGRPVQTPQGRCLRTGPPFRQCPLPPASTVCKTVWVPGRSPTSQLSRAWGALEKCIQVVPLHPARGSDRPPPQPPGHPLWTRKLGSSSPGRRPSTPGGNRAARGDEGCPSQAGPRVAQTATLQKDLEKRKRVPSRAGVADDGERTSRPAPRWPAVQARGPRRALGINWRRQRVLAAVTAADCGTARKASSLPEPGRCRLRDDSVRSLDRTGSCDVHGA